METFELMRKQLDINLKLLSTQEFIRKSKENIEINPQTFVRLSAKAFHLITYHLFQTLNSEECRKRFMGCFPVKDRKQEAEFRQTTYKWLLEISSKQTSCQFPRVLPIYFQHFTPELIVCQLYLDFSNYVLMESIKEITGVSALELPNSCDIETISTSNSNIYHSNVDQLRHETEAQMEQLRYFWTTHQQICKSLNELQLKENQILQVARDKHNLTHESDVFQYIENKFKELKNEITKITDVLTQMNELANEKHEVYSLSIKSLTHSSTELSIDLSTWFDKGVAQKCLPSLTQQLLSQLETIDRTLRNVCSDSLDTFDEVCQRYLQELDSYKQKLVKVYNQMASMISQSRALSLKKKTQLLSNPEIIERRKWFTERVVDISKIQIRLEVKDMSTDESQEKVETKAKEHQNNIDLSDDGPPVRPRPSFLDYSFQVMDISTCQYIPPSGCPLSMNDSHLFSPIDKDS